MDAKQLLEILNQIEARGIDLATLQVVIPVHRPGSLGPSPAAEVARVAPGIDWNSKRLLVSAESALTQLSVEEAEAMVRSARDGQSYKSYRLQQENDGLKAEVVRLRALLAAAENGNETLDAVRVLRLLDTGSWRLTKHPPDPEMTEDFNSENAWSVTREKAPYADRHNNRIWMGKTALKAIACAMEAIFGSDEAAYHG